MNKKFHKKLRTKENPLEIAAMKKKETGFFKSG